MFKHYLTFTSLPFLGQIEISEPIGFDKAGYKIKQDDGKFSRDVVLALEDTELTFTRSFFEELEIPQTLTNGDTINFASQGFDYLLDIFQNECWEGSIIYTIEKDNTTFALGEFDYVTAIIEFDSIKVKIIQNTNREIIKRLQDTDVNAFNDKALDDREITPCSTTNILLKAKPINESTTWALTETKNLIAGNFGPYNNYSANITESGIQDDLTFLSRELFLSTFVNACNNFRVVVAQNDLTNVRLNMKSNINFQYRVDGGNSSSKAGSQLICVVFQSPLTIGTLEPSMINILTEKFFEGTADQDYTFPTDVTFTLPDIPRGFSACLFWSYSWMSEHVNETVWDLTQCDFTISGTSTAIDTVVKGVRLIDLVKHNVQSMADVSVIAPDYDFGGEHYNNFAFNGLLLGQITDKPFNNKFKDLVTFTKETCSDYQINESSIEILPYAQYYNDIEMASFDELPSFTASTKVNKRYSLKTAEFKYKRSSDQRQNNSQNSIDDVHTETQKFITDKVDGNLKVEIDHIRSAFLLEEARRRAFDNEQTKSLQNDDNLFLLKCIPLAPSSQGGFGAVLLMQINDSGHLQILNNNTDGDGISFNWNLLGFNVGSQFFIDSGENVGTWQVLEITNSVLTLFPISVSASFEGEAYITMRWFFTDVLLTNQTDEGFTVIEGIENPTNYSNLDYHWARNIQRWNGYLATATKFKPDGIIKTASFKTNGDLVTRKDGESVNIVDSADIVNSEIASQKILNPFIHSIKVYADLNTMKQLISDVQTVKGYCTFNLNDGRTIKGHIKEMDYTFINEELDVEVEERFIGDFMEITPTSITYPNYPEKNNLESFQINNIFVLLFSSDDVQLYPPVRFTNIKINGVAYTDIVEFTDALTTLINE